MSYQQNQPMATVGMSVSGGNRNAAGKPVDSNGKREWSDGLFGCSEDCGTFILACICPCVVHGKNKQRLSHLNEKNSPDPDGGSFCSGACFGHCVLTSCLGAGFILQCMNRGNVRERYSIEGGGCGDCLASLCCTPCDLTQVSREIELEEKSFGQRY